MPETQNTVDAALDAISRGFQIVPIRTGLKKPSIPGWTHITWDPTTTRDDFEARLRQWDFNPDEPFNIGVILGTASRGLIDVDLDHFRTNRLKDFFLPRTQARSGRAGRPNSHYWYLADDVAHVPTTRRHKMPGVGGAAGEVSVEFRYSNAQTVIAPSIHPSGESYAWTREPWGGDRGPTVISGRKLATQVALLALGTVLIDGWPTSGSRHDTYLALAGGLLRDGNAVHPFWAQNASVLIRALAEATNDDDGPDARESEVMGSTVKGILDGKNVWGFPKLAEIMGDEHVKMVRTLVGEVESTAGFVSRQAQTLPDAQRAPAATGNTPSPSVPATAPKAGSGDDSPESRDAEVNEAAWTAGESEAEEESTGSWAPVDLDPILSGQLTMVSPTVLARTDGQCLFYPGRVNMLFAPSEAGKTWVALQTVLQVMAGGERAVYLDFEDEPVNTISRLRALGAGDDDIRQQFTYIRPDEPIAGMQKDRWGSHRPSSIGERNAELFREALETVDPAIIVADGMTSIYGLHGLDSNSAVETDVITTWLKSLARNGRTTVIIIDHTSKGAERGSMPTGSQHKVAMVQGSLLQVWPVNQPIPNAIGKLELIVLKDRPGQVRANSGPTRGKAQVAAIVTIDSTVNGGASTVMTIDPPSNAGAGGSASGGSSAGTVSVDLTASKLVAKQERIERMNLTVLAAFDNVLGKTLSRKEIGTAVLTAWKALGETSTGFNTTVDRLVVDGWLTKSGSTNKAAYTLAIKTTDPDD